MARHAVEHEHLVEHWNEGDLRQHLSNAHAREVPDALPELQHRHAGLHQIPEQQSLRSRVVSSPSDGPALA